MDWKTIKNFILDEWDNLVEEVKALLSMSEKDSCDNSVEFICKYLDRNESGIWYYDSDEDTYIDSISNKAIKPEEIDCYD